MNKPAKRTDNKGLSQASPPDGADLAVLKERLNWHRMIGISMFTAYALIFSGLITWYLPKELAALSVSVGTQVSAAKASLESGMRQETGILSDKVAALSEKIAVLTAEVELSKPGATQRLPRLMKQNASTAGPELQNGLLLVKALADKARSAGIRLDPRDLKEVAKDIGDKAISQPQFAAAARSAISALIGYRTFLNVLPTGLRPVPRGFYRWGAEFFSTENSVTTVTFDNRLVPKSEAAVLEPLGKDLNSTRSFGPRYIIVENGGARLDGFRMKNVIFRNFRTTYSGGPVQMENVLFVNCYFEITSEGQGKKLVDRLLDSPRIDFVVR